MKSEKSNALYNGLIYSAFSIMLIGIALVIMTSIDKLKSSVTTGELLIILFLVLLFILEFYEYSGLATDSITKYLELRRLENKAEL